LKKLFSYLNIKQKKLKGKGEKVLDMMSIIPGLSTIPAGIRFLKGQQHIRTFDHKSRYNRLISGATGSFFSTMGMQPSNLISKITDYTTASYNTGVEKLASAVKSAYNSNILLQNEIISKYYKVVRNNNGISQLVLLDHLKNNNSELPNPIDIANEGFDTYDQKYKIELSPEKFEYIKKIPYVKGSTKANLTRRYMALIPFVSTALFANEYSNLHDMGLIIENNSYDRSNRELIKAITGAYLMFPFDLVKEAYKTLRRNFKKSSNSANSPEVTEPAPLANPHEVTEPKNSTNPYENSAKFTEPANLANSPEATEHGNLDSPYENSANPPEESFSNPYVPEIHVTSAHNPSEESSIPGNPLYNSH
jgi:hypothetical protein